MKNDLDEAIVEFLNKNSFTWSEYHVISTLIYYPWHIDCLANMTHGESQECSFPPSLEACKNAIQLLLSKKTIAITDAQFLDQIKMQVNQKEDTQPIVLPNIGDVEFTPEGRDVVLDFFKVNNFDDNVAWGSETTISPIHIRLYNTTEENIKHDLELYISQHENSIKFISEIKEIGPWWERFWLRFPKGVCIDIHLFSSEE